MLSADNFGGGNYVARRHALEFPFTEVSQFEVAIYGISNFLEAIKACPVEFRSYRNPWNFLAETMILNPRAVDTSLFQHRETDPVNRASKKSYLDAWLMWRFPIREEKVAVCGWLLSLMLTDLPEPFK